MRRRPTWAGLRAGLALLAVLALCLLGGRMALGGFSVQRDLSVASVSVGTDAFHDGALDLYVPLVDWGVRFPGVRLPVRLKVDVRAVDRDAAARIAQGGELPVRELREEATDAIASYIRLTVLVVAGASLALGLLGALALRSRSVAPVRRLIATAVLGAVACGGLVVWGLPPRGALDDPTYYARGPDIPVALRALQGATQSADRLEEELDGQLVGLAQLVEDPARRPALRGLPRLVAASDLHNNVLAIPALERAAAGRPVLFAGDLTDRGSPLEGQLVERVVHVGEPFVFVAGNHDSDALERRLARAGAIVLRRDGQVRADGSRGPVVVRAAGLRIAGFESPNVRRRAGGYRDEGAEVDEAEREAFRSWVLGLAGQVDVVLVHEPALVGDALDVLRADVTLPPLLVVSGHTHQAAVRADRDVVEVNGGSIGAGGTGNLGDGTDLSLAVVTFRRDPFAPLAVDTVAIDPATGAATATRVRVASHRGTPQP
ncbi:metallophosphoesterase family protein [Conexibacter sp. SYSU D00693]|uniref:metallophosphoesterase family protein n=1 Tax=Conexibacter sp. SYSU D00693 TaxID=2812560 RepID=UPI00196AD86F|nr:metallophosphoesterase [Conexibacter sp. SYSU D00693]